MSVLVTGAKGQIGYEMVKLLMLRGIECNGVDIEDFDITNKQQALTVITAYKPDTIIHCAAYTDVDQAEDCRELCYSVNVAGTGNVAEICKEINAKMIYLSTDYVFDGNGEEAFEVAALKKPINFYGYTKYMGEKAVQRNLAKYFIVRTSWVFGLPGDNFVKTILRLGREKQALSVVSDQIGSPTYTFDLVKILADMAQSEEYGVYHATNEGYCSRYEFAEAIIKTAGLNCEIIPITTAQYKTSAKRPHNSKLSKASLDEAGFERLPSWDESLNRFIAFYNSSYTSG